ncbi:MULTISPECIES: hypothetical protein [unclassified Paenibacillus]|uniref:hypothetical protein n=1 Tax=unclassified Paenibacillus TaxID=185978 RepID=UPI001AE67A87|nr:MULTISPECIES: hypothetical protein [unclassified Paenibacillus]MBP1155555.1 hypothetical protein [Paenibacillus sp. PvP091]MBP1169059.1 hypothetical protein [Paenibacillus sp. PvR098]MBP2440087.1 hypothetical protein [Paenibacillus sp. PvP052]
MNAKVEQALNITIRNWNSMSGSNNDEAESTANEFESSFYLFIDTVREWADGLNPRPQTLEEFLEQPMIQDILDLLPTPLHLNFETEAELIVDNKSRIDDAKYD